jgi:hypothetical protein
MICRRCLAQPSTTPLPPTADAEMGRGRGAGDAPTGGMPRDSKPEVVGVEPFLAQRARGQRYSLSWMDSSRTETLSADGVCERAEAIPQGGFVLAAESPEYETRAQKSHHPDPHALRGAGSELPESQTAIVGFDRALVAQSGPSRARVSQRGISFSHNGCW